MAAGDMTITVAVEGGVNKSVVLASATRAKILLQATKLDGSITTDAGLQVMPVNSFGDEAVGYCNTQLREEAVDAVTSTTLTRAT